MIRYTAKQHERTKRQEPEQEQNIASKNDNKKKNQQPSTITGKPSTTGETLTKQEYKYHNTE